MDSYNDPTINEFSSQQRGRTLRRGRTLNRPERFNPPEPMLGPSKKKKAFSWWVFFSKVVTFWAPSFVLKKVGFPDKNVIQAWREKVTLCFIILLICGFVVFITLFLSDVLCSAKSQDQDKNYIPVTTQPTDYVVFKGMVFSKNNANVDMPDFLNKQIMPDISQLINSPLPESCQKLQLQSSVVTFDSCTIQNCLFSIDQIEENGFFNTKKKAAYDWKNLPQNFFVLNGVVIDLSSYLKNRENIGVQPNDKLDMTIMELKKTENTKDVTRKFLHNQQLKKSTQCIVDKYKAGVLNKYSPGCFGNKVFQTLALVVILGIVLVRFVMAAVFHWFLSHRLSRTPKNPQGPPIVTRNMNGMKSRNISNNPNELFTILLVTCYSEGEDSMRTTVDSLANTEYSDDKKLLFIIADGIITGSGNDKSTPDIIKEMIEIDPKFNDPQPMSYIAVADGSKQHNMAKVYCGHYVTNNNHRVPVIAVIKCGAPQERDKPKPGNRGKRDSQLILMGFFSRVIYNDRMTPLDYDLFVKIHHLMGVTPDYFETVLMVDADTKVYPSSLRLLTNCLLNDGMVMGLCGETKIANKKDSLVTTIQVFEYYISHHLGKGFESVFGGVTCLPGCFCMYRLKARKGDNDWTPIITKPEIIQEYSQNVVETLHEKNLLLLGEDRFLTTLMIRNFPNRKMMFVPQAICKTVVPDEFSVLLSQRRRWINSTIHNLLELVLVRNLCGTFCFSMQFVILMELIGTVVLPVAIIMTYYLIVSLFFTPNIKNSLVPLILLILVLFSPAILILITTRKMVYVAWMFVYLVFLFVWNFILPVYSYWNFDDFSWGATRMVEGEQKGDGHGKKEGAFDAKDVPLKRWDEYERLRLKSNRKNSTADPHVLENQNNSIMHYNDDSVAYSDKDYDFNNYSINNNNQQQPQNAQLRNKPAGPRPLN